jgi:hypothetical protein
MDTSGSFPGGKARSRIHGAIFPLPNTPSWRGVQLKKETPEQLYLYLVKKFPAFYGN